MPARVRERVRPAAAPERHRGINGRDISKRDIRRRVADPVGAGAGPVDTPVTLAGQGFPAGSAVTITASAFDTTNVTWSASAVFSASDTGGFSTATAPVSGSYGGANAMGLFEFLAPPPGVSPRQARYCSTVPALD